MGTARLSWASVALAVFGVLGASAFAARPAQACGGLFCNQSNPVNQAAERILFADHGDGSITAVIEIQYEGPPSDFSWILPVPGVPDVEVSSVRALDRLQQATNPQYNLITSFEDGCPVPAATRGAAFDSAGGAPEELSDDGITVEAAGTVGPFLWEVISVNPALPEPADAALEWLMENGYDVTEIGPSVLGPYLANGLNLIAFRLTSESDAGSIRPVLLTYRTELPFIPIRLTAVAAKEDMGVLVFTVAQARAIPENYKALELNEALIDWFNPMASYDAVVSAAAEEAGGQGFVTELAREASAFEGVVVPEWEAQQWQELMSREFSDPLDFLFEAADYYAAWDGFEDAVREAVSLPAGVSIRDFIRCARCYRDEPGFELNESDFRLALYTLVVKPMLDTEDLLQSGEYLTRLYTTMSAEDMTVDPLFDYNADLGDVDNVHTAEQIMSCQSEAFRVELSTGEVIRGEQTGTWPNAIGDQPAARRIFQLTTQGEGEMVTDNRATIERLLANPTQSEDEASGDGASGGGGGLCAVARPGATQHGAVRAILWIAAAIVLARRRRV